MGRRPARTPASRSVLLGLVLLLLLLACGAAALADEVTLEPAADATLYEDASGDAANGAGDYLFAGMTAEPTVRRALLRFDLTSIPPGSIVDSVELTLTMSRSIVGEENVALHRATTAWSEGPSDALGPEGVGAPAQAGDVTWLHTDYDTTFWTTPGGDFEPTASAARGVANVGTYTWGSTPGLVADVQSWVDGTRPNHGWMLVGYEASAPTAKRFDSRENPDPGSRPALRVVFTPAGGTLADIPLLDPRALAALALLLALAGARLVGRS